MFEKPGVVGPASKFFASVKTVLEHPDAYDHFSVKGSTGLSYELDKKQTRFGRSRARLFEDHTTPSASTNYLIASIPLQYVYDNRDNRLNPTSGFRVLAFAEPSYDILTGAAFVKLKGEGSAYQSLDTAGEFVLAERVALGSIVGAGLRGRSGRPALLFRRRRFGARLCLSGHRPEGHRRQADRRAFLLRDIGRDAHRASPTRSASCRSSMPAPSRPKRFPDFSDVKVGAGVGLRYITPFGPLRIDAAVPLNRDPGDPRFGIYAGIGQAF